MRGLGGSLLYFVDPKSELGRLWDIDFNAPKNRNGNGGAGLTAIDHVSQSMHYEEMLSWLLFYNSLLDVTKTPQLDVIDPGGIVRSQVVQTADGSAAHRAQRLAEPADVVVALPDALFRLGRAAHRACDRRHRRDRASSSAPTAWRCCRSRRTTTTISRRAPISPRSGSTCCARNDILYDRDEAGEYLQAYTRSFEDLFFFEIVERRGYKGFGAVNASIRLAAQTRESGNQDKL